MLTPMCSALLTLLLPACSPELPRSSTQLGLLPAVWQEQEQHQLLGVRWALPSFLLMEGLSSRPMRQSMELHAPHQPYSLLLERVHRGLGPAELPFARLAEEARDHSAGSEGLPRQGSLGPHPALIREAERGGRLYVSCEAALRGSVYRLSLGGPSTERALLAEALETACARAELLPLQREEPVSFPSVDGLLSGLAGMKVIAAEEGMLLLGDPESGLRAELLYAVQKSGPPFQMVRGWSILPRLWREGCSPRGLEVVRAGWRDGWRARCWVEEADGGQRAVLTHVFAGEQVWVISLWGEGESWESLEESSEAMLQGADLP